MVQVPCGLPQHHVATIATAATGIAMSCDARSGLVTANRNLDKGTNKWTSA